ncbi:MAG: DUF4197 domain-containing protein [Candidatus Binatia bacterium]
MKARVLGIGTMLLLLSTPTWAQLDRMLEGLSFGQKSGLSDVKVGSGLKEALKIGTGNTVNLTGRTNGYFRNKAIKILMPKTLQRLEKPLRLVGYGPQIDDFVLSMNRAAEQAAPFAKDIFWNAIAEMSFDDAKKILAGNDTAATDYFKAKTTDKLSVAFRPVVENAMNQTGVTRHYKDLVKRYEKIPFTKSMAFDIDRYVVEKSMDGLFYVLGQEEKKIRKNPAARVTNLLKEVFGS